MRLTPEPTQLKLISVIEKKVKNLASGPNVIKLFLL